MSSLLSKIFEKYNVDPDNAPKIILREFIKDKFKVLENNLVHQNFRKKLLKDY
jgi:hypothetical protein